MLLEHEVYRQIKSLDIQPVLDVIDQLRFKDSKGVCAWVSDPDVPAPEELLQLVRSCNLGGRYHRVYCRKLMPRQNIAPHVDDHKWLQLGNFRRFQIPLISHPDIKMRWPNDNIEVWLEPGYLWEVRFNRLHEVVHNADCERIHIQIDQEDATIG